MTGAPGTGRSVVPRNWPGGSVFVPRGVIGVDLPTPIGIKRQVRHHTYPHSEGERPYSQPTDDAPVGGSAMAFYLKHRHYAAHNQYAEPYEWSDTLL